MEHKIKMEPIVIMFSILLLTALGIRAGLQTEFMEQQNQIRELSQQINIQVHQAKYLKGKLKPLPYSQPVKDIVISSGTGMRVNPLGGGTEALHKGDDIIGKLGDPVNAVLVGRVVEHWLPPGWHHGKYYEGHPIMGGYIVIDHGDGLFSLYAHLSKTSVHEEDWIKAGEQIGEMGSTGMSTGVHLHLEIVIKPFKYLEERR